MVNPFWSRKNNDRIKPLQVSKLRPIEAIWLRWRLWKVCRKLGIKPYDFQREFALTGRCKYPRGRCNGKTMAVMLYGLIRYVNWETGAQVLAHYDPDACLSHMRRDVFVREYMRLCEKVNG